MILTHGANSISRGWPGWTEDESVTTSLGHKIPVEDCGIEMSLQSVNELPYMHTLENSCGIAMSLVGQEELPYMHTLEDNCGIEIGLVSIGSMTDTTTIGGRTYRTIKMPDGNEWLAENLDYKFLVDGNQIPIGASGDTPTTPAAWYYNNDETNYGIDGTYKCGLLYNWYAAKYLNDNKATLIPGWHVPTLTEWQALAVAISGSFNGASEPLKSISNSITTNFPPSGWNGTDVYGFNMLPGGYYRSGFSAIGTYGDLWTSTEVDTNFAMYMGFSSSVNLYDNSGDKKYAHSVRLVKDIN